MNGIVFIKNDVATIYSDTLIILAYVKHKPTKFPTIRIHLTSHHLWNSPPPMFVHTIHSFLHWYIIIIIYKYIIIFIYILTLVHLPRHTTTQLFWKIFVVVEIKCHHDSDIPCVFCCGHGQCQHAPELSGDCSRYLDSHSRRSYNNRVHNCSKFLPFQFRKRRFRCTRKIVGTGGEEEGGGEAGKFALLSVERYVMGGGEGLLN